MTNFARRLKLLIALAGFCFVAACGGPVGVDEPAAPTESASTYVGGIGVFTGSYTCGGETWTIDQWLINTVQRRAGGLSNLLVTDLGANTGLPPTGEPIDYAHNKVTLLCGTYKFPEDASCGSDRFCSLAAATCRMYAKPAGFSAWSFSGWIDGGGAVYFPSLSPNGTYQLLLHYHYVPSQPGDGRGLASCGAFQVLNPPALSFVFGA